MRLMMAAVLVVTGAACSHGRLGNSVSPVPSEQELTDISRADRIVDAYVQQVGTSPVYELITVDRNGQRMGVTLNEFQVFNVYVKPELKGTFVWSFIYRNPGDARQRWVRYTSVFVPSEASKTEWESILKSHGSVPTDVRPRTSAHTSLPEQANR